MWSSRVRTASAAALGVALLGATSCASNGNRTNPAVDRTNNIPATTTAVHRPSPPTDPATTSSARSTNTTTDASLIEPYSFASDQVAPPLPLPTEAPDTAVFKLLSYHDWLYSHNPDVALMANAYIERSSYWEPVFNDLTSLAKNQRRLYDVGTVYRITKREIIARNHRLFIANPIIESRLVNRDGSSYEIWHKPEGSTFVATIVLYNGEWKIADLGPYGNRPVLKERA